MYPAVRISESENKIKNLLIENSLINFDYFYNAIHVFLV